MDDYRDTNFFPPEDGEEADVHFPQDYEPRRDAFLETPKNKVSEGNTMDNNNQNNNNQPQQNNNQSAYQKYSHTAQQQQKPAQSQQQKPAQQPQQKPQPVQQNNNNNQPHHEGVIFSSSVLKSVLEEVSDDQAANIDTIMTNTDLLSKFDNICPVSGTIFDCMKAAAADPNNLKIACSSSNEAYIEALEFLNFCEANGGIEVDEAVKLIAEECIPGLGCEKTHIVFPSECRDSSVLGVNDLGMATGHTWQAKLLNGCLRYGLIPHVGVEVAKESGDACWGANCGEGKTDAQEDQGTTSTADKESLKEKTNSKSWGN